MDKRKLIGKSPVTKNIHNPYLNPVPSTSAVEATTPPNETEGVVDETTAPRRTMLEDQSKVEERRSPVEEKKDDENLTDPPSPQDKHGSSPEDRTPNTGLAYWERLPSKNLSHGSAEILTIEECVKHSALYKGRAVRVTGQLHSRNFVGDDIVSPRLVLLELMDPAMAAPKLTSTGRKTPKTPAKEESQTPGKTADTSDALATPGMTPRTPYKTPRKTIGPMRPPTSGSSVLSNASIKTPGSNILSAKRKRPWFATSARKKTPPKTLPRPVLKVVVDPELPRISEIAPCGSSKVLALGVIMENGWLQARFVSLVKPELDMSQYVISLESRRRFLYQRYKTRQPENDNPDEGMENAMETQGVETPTLLLGCGPPPYDRLEQQEPTVTEFS